MKKITTEALGIMMKQAWEEWHFGVNEAIMPRVNISFEKGFNAAVEILLPMLEIKINASKTDN